MRKFLGRLFGATESTPPPSLGSPAAETPIEAADVPELLDVEVNQQMLNAIRDTTTRHLERISTGFLAVLEQQLASLKDVEAQFPDGLPTELVAADVTNFAENLALQCTSTSKKIIAAFDKDGDNVLKVFQRVYDNASNYEYEVRKQVIRGSDAIYSHGRHVAIGAHPALASVASLDTPWLVARNNLLRDSCDERAIALSQARSPDRRAMAPIVVLDAMAENAVWERTAHFRELFLPVLRGHLVNPAPDWRSDETLRTEIDRALVISILPNAPDESGAYRRFEDAAFAFFCFETNVVSVQDELASELPARLFDRWQFAEKAALADRVETLVAVTVERGFDDVLEEALRITRAHVEQSARP